MACERLPGRPHMNNPFVDEVRALLVGLGVERARLVDELY